MSKTFASKTMVSKIMASETMVSKTMTSTVAIDSVCLADCAHLFDKHVPEQPLTLPTYNSSDGDATFSHVLTYDEGKLSLKTLNAKPVLSTHVDFVSGALFHRLKYGGGKSQMIAKAVGLGKVLHPSVLDVTAGLAGDAFVLASLGCTVAMLERSDVACLLVADALKRAREALAQGYFEEEWHMRLSGILDNMRLSKGDAHEHLSSMPSDSVDVVYLDPMFPERKKKSAQVKKEMQLFHAVIGEDLDAEALLEPAQRVAKHRVVVKRPKLAPYLAETKPGYSLKGKSSRFDVYTQKSFV